MGVGSSLVRISLALEPKKLLLYTTLYSGANLLIKKVNKVIK